MTVAVVVEPPVSFHEPPLPLKVRAKAPRFKPLKLTFCTVADVLLKVTPAPELIVTVVNPVQSRATLPNPAVAEPSVITVAATWTKV